MNTIKNNRLIAEFMGLAYCDRHMYEGWYKSSEFNYRICDDDGLQYHTSWDWIMPVVEKIESMNYTVTIRQGHVSICSNSYRKPYYTGGDNVEINKIQAVYQAVVEFIEWYNKNK
mgnify:FL=1